MQTLDNRNRLKAIATFTLFVASLAMAALPPWTNSFFLTDDGSIIYHQGENIFYVPEKIEAARLSKESRLAENDPEGNWGSVSEGFHLSLRFLKDTFMVGEPITATVILRNVTSGKLECNLSHPISDYEILVVDSLKRQIPYRRNLRAQYSRGSAGSNILYEGWQWRYELRVDELFDMTSPGAYLIYTRRQVHTVGKNGPSDVVSGNTIIQIVNAPRKAGQANPVNAAATTPSFPTALDNPESYSVFGTSKLANSRPSTSAAAPKSAANTPKNILHPGAKAPINQPPAQLAQAETGGGFSKRDWVFGLLVLGLVLGLGGLLFRARASRPRS